MGTNPGNGVKASGYKTIVYIICMVAALGGLLFGLDQGFIANSLDALTQHYRFAVHDKEKSALEMQTCLRFDLSRPSQWHIRDDSGVAEKMAIAFGVLMKVLRQGLCRVPGQIWNGIADFGQFTGGDLQKVSDKNFHLIFVKPFSR
jgi:hypothetical protein